MYITHNLLAQSPGNHTESGALSLTHHSHMLVVARLDNYLSHL